MIALLSATLSEFDRRWICHGLIHPKHDEQQGWAHSLFRVTFKLHANADVYKFFKEELSQESLRSRVHHGVKRGTEMHLLSAIWVFCFLTVSSSSFLFSVGSRTGFSGRSKVGIQCFQQTRPRKSDAVYPLRTRGLARMVTAKLITAY